MNPLGRSSRPGTGTHQRRFSRETGRAFAPGRFRPLRRLDARSPHLRGAANVGEHLPAVSCGLPAGSSLGRDQRLGAHGALAGHVASPDDKSVGSTALEVLKLPDAKCGCVLRSPSAVERRLAAAPGFRRLGQNCERLPAAIAGLHLINYARSMRLRAFRMDTRPGAASSSPPVASIRAASATSGPRRTGSRWRGALRVGVGDPPARRARRAQD